MTKRRDRSLPTRWREAVFASQQLTPAAKVALLLMAEGMKDSGRISVPRADLARLLGCAERRVADHVSQGIQLRYLHKVGGGYRGLAAVYQALLPPEYLRTEASLPRLVAGYRPPNIVNQHDVIVSGMDDKQRHPNARVTTKAQRGEGARAAARLELADIDLLVPTSSPVAATTHMSGGRVQDDPVARRIEARSTEYVLCAVLGCGLSTRNASGICRDHVAGAAAENSP